MFGLSRWDQQISLNKEIQALLDDQLKVNANLITAVKHLMADFDQLDTNMRIISQSIIRGENIARN